MLVPRMVATYGAAGYLTLAGILVGVGGMLLLGLHPVGRRMMSWGALLIRLLGYFALILVVFLPRFQESDAGFQEIAHIVGWALVGHVVLNTAIGALGQTVGRPSDYIEPKPEPTWKLLSQDAWSDFDAGS